jgi:hypothetical protein
LGKGLGNEQEFSGGLARFKIAVGLCGVCEGVGVGHTDVKSAIGDPAEDVAGSLLEISAEMDVVLESGAGNVEGAHGGEADEIEGRDGAGGSAEEDERAAGAKTLERLLNGGLADGVVDDGEAFTAGDFMDAANEVFTGVEDDVVGSGLAGECGFLFCRHGGDHVDAETLGDLDEEKTCSAGAGVDKYLVAELGDEGGEEQVVGGHALEERGGSLLGGDIVRNVEQAVCGGYGVGGVGSGDAAPGDAIAGGKVGDVRGDGDDGARGFLTQGVGQFGGVAAFAEVGVNEVDAGGFDGNEGFAGSGGWIRELSEGQDFRAAGLIDLYGLHSCGC